MTNEQIVDAGRHEPDAAPPPEPVAAPPVGWKTPVVDDEGEEEAGYGYGV